MTIEKDKCLNKWVVWLRIGGVYIDIFKSKYKKDCKEWIKKNEKAVTRKICI